MSNVEMLIIFWGAAIILFLLIQHGSETVSIERSIRHFVVQLTRALQGR